MNTLLNKKQRKTFEIFTGLAAAGMVFYVIVDDNQWFADYWGYMLFYVLSMACAFGIGFVIGHDKGHLKGQALGYENAERTRKAIYMPARDYHI